MTWDEKIEALATHYAALAQTPGWWDYATQQVICMESQPGSQWIGLRDATRSKLVSVGFVYAKDFWPSRWWENDSLKEAFANRWLEKHPSTNQKLPVPVATVITSNERRPSDKKRRR